MPGWDDWVTSGSLCHGGVGKRMDNIGKMTGSILSLLGLRHLLG